MNSQTAKLVHRSVIRYLNNERTKGEELAKEAIMNLEMEKFICPKCYKHMVQGIWRIRKKESMKVYLCTVCGGMKSRESEEKAG